MNLFLENALSNLNGIFLQKIKTLLNLIKLQMLRRNNTFWKNAVILLTGIFNKISVPAACQLSVINKIQYKAEPCTSTRRRR